MKAALGLVAVAAFTATATADVLWDQSNVNTGINAFVDQEFDDFVMNLLRDVQPGYNFILGMGDNVPFNAVFDRVKRVTELVEKHGRLPMSI